MARLEIIAAELQADPKTLGYAGMDAHQAAAALNQVGLSGETRERTLVETWELAAAVVLAEWRAIVGAADREMFRAICACVRVDVQNARLRATLAGIFTQAIAPSTRARLLELQVESVSRAEALGLSRVEWTEIAQARGQ